MAAVRRQQGQRLLRAYCAPGTFLSSLAVLTHRIFMSPSLWRESEYEPIAQTRHLRQTLHSLPTATKCHLAGVRVRIPHSRPYRPPPSAEAKAEGQSPQEGARSLHPRDLRCSHSSVSLQSKDTNKTYEMGNRIVLKGNSCSPIRLPSIHL